MRSVLAYTASRLLLFAVALGLLYLLGARGFLLLALAFLTSGLVSYILLARQRDAMSQVVADGLDRFRGMGRRLDEGAAKEDPGQPVTARDKRPADDGTATAGTESGESARGTEE
ncbi:DUF4229 domain-containing protein [Salinactinospora qingdaonensis]|uniref:DUF4229 domain-containing protein n=1 Tax=Salinactinospora qingdaonensis TaxID=702744 RepID=A0ABP7G1K9_9ACTN